MRVMVAMLGARRRYLLPEVMEELGVLTCFVTDTYVGKSGWMQRAATWLAHRLPKRSLLALAGRVSPRLPARKIVARQWLGIRYALAARFVRSGDVRLFASVNRTFCIRAASHLKSIDVCWAYNGAALELFERARRNSIKCVLEQVIAPRGDELCEVARAANDWPAWIDGVEAKPESASDPLGEREQKEWRLADVIVTGSRFVQERLEQAGVPLGHCAVVPSAIDLDRFPVATERRDGGPLRILFAGQINLRKGVPYLLEAVRRLNSPQVKLKLVGLLQVPRDCIGAYARWATFAGPVPLSEIAAQYHWADIVVVPSVCEGSAMVTYEARGCGVPILATPNAGAFFKPGVDGLEIPVRDVEAIATVLDRLAGNRDEVRRLRDGAIANRHLLGRDAYHERIRHVLDIVAGDASRRRRIQAGA